MGVVLKRPFSQAPLVRRERQHDPNQRSLRLEPPRIADIGIAAKTRVRRSAEAHPDRVRTDLARRLCLQALTIYWGTQFAGRPLRNFDLGSGRALRHDEIEAATELGRIAGRMDPASAAYLIGSTYAATLPSDVRSERGVFYTPPHLVDRLLDAATEAGVQWSSCKVLDPACGGGAFLAPVAERILGALPNRGTATVLRAIGERLRGFEIDPFAAWISNVFLDAAIYRLTRCRDVRQLNVVHVLDSLTQHAAGPYDLVVANPPYGRVSLTESQRTLFSESLFGHANLYAVFMDLAVRWSADHGVIAFVTPTSFLSGEYFKRLRSLLARSAPPASFDFVLDRSGVFDDVLQETVLATYRKAAAMKPARVHFVGADSQQVAPVEIELPTDPCQPWILPRVPSSISVVRHVASLKWRLRDWGYRVSTGPLVWNRHKAQLRWKPAKNTAALIWAEAVTPDGRFVFQASRRNHAPYLAVGESDDWLLVRKECVLLQRTTAKEQPRRLVAAALPKKFLVSQEAVTVENHLNMLVPLESGCVVSPAALAAFLNSASADAVFRCISGSVAVSAFELEAMPLPDPQCLADLEIALTSGASQADLDATCARLYGKAR